MSWIICQIGAREHYSVARALERTGSLAGMLTDFWVPPGSPISRIPGARRLRDRWHPALAEAKVYAPNLRMLAFEMKQRLQRQSGWPVFVQRNALFQKRALLHLYNLRPPTSVLRPPTLFAYSYAALELFKHAKRRGWRTVLGQIDPAVGEERIVRELSLQHQDRGSAFAPAPAEYWEHWREECELANHIVVNSEWSKILLEREGIAGNKVRVIPLAYEHVGGESCPAKSYPKQFSDSRPLRVLFLGQVNVRKGAVELIEAAGELAGEPIEFWFVGPVQLRLQKQDLAAKNIRFIGGVPRSQVAEWYRAADVFAFPTHSDGFGLTQLEALHWRLPLITSANCGEVVVDGKNGRLLKEVTKSALVSCLRGCLASPDSLAGWSQQCEVPSRFSLDMIGGQFLALES